MNAWVGYHESIGIVIYDPNFQHSIEPNYVRLWDVEKQQLRMFEKERVRRGLVSLAAHLKAGGLGSLESMLRISSQLEAAYFKNPPSRKAMPSGSNYWCVADPWQGQDVDDESALVISEIIEDQYAWAQSEAEGWYYK